MKSTIWMPISTISKSIYVIRIFLQCKFTAWHSLKILTFAKISSPSIDFRIPRPLNGEYRKQIEQPIEMITCV